MCVYRKEFPEYTADWAPYSLLHPGDDRFADPDELRQRFGLVRKREDLHAGGMPILAGPEGAVFQNDDSMSIVFGQSGSKKTRLLVAPTLVSLAYAHENIVAVDIKGELTDPDSNIGQTVCGALAENGYEIVRLNFRTFDQSSVNLLEVATDLFQAGDIAGAISALHELTTAITRLSTVPNQDPFWVQNAQALLTGISFLLLFLAAFPDQLNLYTLSTYLNDDGLEELSKICHALPDAARNHPILVQLLNICDFPDKTRSCVLGTATGMLNFITSNTQLLHMISTSGFHFRELSDPDKRIALILVMPDETDAYDTLEGIVVQQLLSVLLKQAAANGGALPVRLNFVMDEFCNIRISSMDRYISALRSRNIRWFIVCQSLQQLRSVYPTQASTILANCSNWFYLRSNELELLELLSFHTGQTHLNERGEAAPLLSTHQLMQLRKGTDYTEALYLSGDTVLVTRLPDISLYQVPAAPEGCTPPQKAIARPAVLDAETFSRRVSFMKKAAEHPDAVSAEAVSIRKKMRRLTEQYNAFVHYLCGTSAA